MIKNIQDNLSMWRLACMTRIPCSYCIVVYGVHCTERCIARGGTAQAARQQQAGRQQCGLGWAGWQCCSNHRAGSS